jgi:phosphotriesterase-related protein
MTRINSVLGPLDTADLGFTLSHDHIILSSAGIRQVYPEFIDRAKITKDAIEHLTECKAEGVDTIVDVTTLDLGRDVELLAAVSEKSGVNIICCTGIWRDIPRTFWEADPDDIAPLFIREIEEGIEGTGIKAGIIKVANDAEGVTQKGEIILRAAARASKATGVPISAHSWSPGRVGEQQIPIFKDEGLDMAGVYIGHSNDTTDLDYLTGLARTGVWIGMDRTPGSPVRPDSPTAEDRTQTIKALVEAGHADRLMVGHDWSVYLGTGGEATRRIYDEHNPDRFLYIIRRQLPRLRELGVSEQDIRRITVDNPRRFFGG